MFVLWLILRQLNDIVFGTSTNVFKFFSKGCLIIDDWFFIKMLELYDTVNSCLVDTLIIRTAAKISYRRLTELYSLYYGLSLMMTLTQGPNSVHYKGS